MFVVVSVLVSDFVHDLLVLCAFCSQTTPPSKNFIYIYIYIHIYIYRKVFFFKILSAYSYYLHILLFFISSSFAYPTFAHLWC